MTCRRPKIPLAGVAHSLQGNNLSARELADLYRMSIDRIEAAVNILRARKQIHIVRFRRVLPGVTLEPVFKWGDGLDARCPRQRRTISPPAPGAATVGRTRLWGFWC